MIFFNEWREHFFRITIFFTPKKTRKMEIRKITKNDNFFSKNVFFTKNKNVKNRKLSIFSSRLEWKNWKNPPPPSCNDVVCEKKLFGKLTIFPIIESGGRGDRWKISNFFIPSVNGSSEWKNWKCDFIDFHENLNFSNRLFQKIEVGISIIAFTQTCPRPASSRPEARSWLPSGCDGWGN